MGIHFLCVNGNECIGIHHAICDTFVVIAWNVDIHMGQEQLQAFFLVILNCFHWRVDIVLTKDEIHTLANVVITDPTRAYLTCADLFPNLAQLKDLLPSIQFKSKKEATKINTSLNNSFF